MSKEKYLKLKGCSSVKELTDEEVQDYFLKGHKGLVNQMFAQDAVYGAFGLEPDLKIATKYMRQALDEEKYFECIYIMGEGVVEKDEDLERIGTSHFEYEVR